MSVQTAVVDTNVLVSALISASGAPALVLTALRHGQLAPVTSQAVLAEYQDVLTRPRFRFPQEEIRAILGMLEDAGLLLDPPPIDITSLPDPDDAAFIALVRHAGCVLITGNVRHFPADLGMSVMTPREWVRSSGVG